MLSEAKTTIIGKVTKVESEAEGAKRAFRRLTIPVNKSYKTESGEKKELTSWLTPVVFNPNVIKVIDEHGIKDRLVRVIAETSTTDSDIEGKRITQINLVVDRFDWLDAKPKSDSE